MQTTVKGLIPRCFDHDAPHNSVNSFATQHKHGKAWSKRFHWRTSRSAVPYAPRAASVRVQKGEPNGLESTENRRSIGWHGNQHVYVRDPQVSGSDIYTSSAGGPPGL